MWKSLAPDDRMAYTRIASLENSSDSIHLSDDLKGLELKPLSKMGQDNSSGLFIYMLIILKAPVTTAADDIHKYFFIVFSEKITLDISSESSARQRIHLKHQALFFSKDNCKILKCCLLQFLFATLRVNGAVTIT